MKVENLTDLQKLQLLSICLQLTADDSPLTPLRMAFPGMGEVDDMYWPAKKFSTDEATRELERLANQLAYHSKGMQAILDWAQNTFSLVAQSPHLIRLPK